MGKPVGKVLYSWRLELVLPCHPWGGVRRRVRLWISKDHSRTNIFEPRAFSMAQWIRNLPAMQETQVT